MIEENISGEDEWAIFQTNFDRIHEKFFTNLKERYPDLTPGDLRLCALLRLNMPTKDMARMQNLSVRGIEAARYRLRKKLNLPGGAKLGRFHDPVPLRNFIVMNEKYHNYEIRKS